MSRSGFAHLLAVARPWAPLLVAFLVAACNPLAPFPDQEKACADSFDAARESAREASAGSFPPPRITTVAVNGALAWSAGSVRDAAPTLRPGDVVTLTGTGFGAGTDIDFSKIMLGNTRILETDLSMYEQELDLFAQVHYELPTTHSTWPKNVLAWSDTEIRFRVPGHASTGPLVVQVQKRVDYLRSLIRPGEPHNVIDAQTYRITDPKFAHACDVVSVLSEAKATEPIQVEIENPGFAALANHGRAIFWSFDFNIGLAHKIRNLDWSAIFAYQEHDPYTGEAADPEKLFGAIPIDPAEVPAEAYQEVYFDPYPQLTPIPGLLLSPQLEKGPTRTTGWVGYRTARSSNPFLGIGDWAGFNCSSCHGYRVTYEATPGATVARVIPGLPNPAWTMKWAVLGEFDGVNSDENGPGWDPGLAPIDKTPLLYSMPQGSAESTLVRLHGEGSLTDNDYEFSPIAIPNVTHYMGIRRSLSHTESYVGFEGSYIHSEEPDGATGSMDQASLEALTAYMTTLDVHDDELRSVGLHRWLAANGRLATQTGGSPSEGAFVQAGWSSYPGIREAVARGEATFRRDCASCHSDGIGYHTDERMFRLDEVGRFFTPTDYQKKQQSIRTNYLRDMYWVQHRGLLSDGHVRNLEDLVSPDRCTPGTPLHDAYYTLHPPTTPPLGGPDFPEPFPAYNRRGDVFRVPKDTTGTPEGDKRNRFVLRHKYFVEVPWDDAYYYWDFQALRTHYGPDEMGSTESFSLPATPHPWCAGSAAEVADLVEYVLTL